MDALLLDWLGMGVRWLHLIAGVAWIGSSFYFMYLDAGLRHRPGLAAGVAGESWQVHGGGFYRMQKYAVAPADMPDELHWFKWEAYTTWLSGFALLGIVYYLNPSLYLIDPDVLAMPPWLAVALGIGSLALGWLVYDGLCKSALGRSDATLAGVGFALLVAAAIGYCLVFAGRGAYIQFGALIGTIMVANVFLVIIPNQKIVVADLIAGRQPDPALGKAGKQRSTHNNYLTLPVLFVMISNHYPMAFAHELNWLILVLVVVVGGVVRHFYNVRHAGGGDPWWTWGVAAAGLAVIITISAYRPDAPAVAAVDEVAFAEVRAVIDQRCAGCHAAQPTFDGFSEAPKNVLLDSPEAIARHAQQIHAQAVATDAMPPGNITEVTADERALLAAWYAAGAPVE